MPLIEPRSLLQKMQMSEVWTPVKLIKWSEKYFADKKTDSPRLTSELLLAHVLKWQRVDLYTKFEYELSPEELKNYKRHSLYPGGQTITSYKEMMAKHPERIIEYAVKRMLPKTRLGNRLIHKLKFTKVKSIRMVRRTLLYEDYNFKHIY